jgi:hypothetical protein
MFGYFKNLRASYLREGSGFKQDFRNAIRSEQVAIEHVDGENLIQCESRGARR